MKKGFTILELLAVVVILGLIAVLITPLVKTMTDDAKNKAYNIQIKAIKDGAESFIVEYIDTLPESDTYTIDLKLLKDLAFLETEIKNPKTGFYFDDNTVITFTKKKGMYRAEIFDKEAETINTGAKYDDYILILMGSNNCETNCKVKTNLIVLNINGVLQNINHDLINISEIATMNEYEIVTYSVILNAKTYSISRLEI